jgi:hypothetical protein
MPFPWSKKVAHIPVQQVVVPVAVPVQEPEPVLTISIPPAVEDVVQSVDLPVIDDKISPIEHKNGECLADTREEDDEAHEVEGDLQEGGWAEESDHGSEEVVERVEDEESSSPRTPLKN